METERKSLSELVAFYNQLSNALFVAAGVYLWRRGVYWLVALYVVGISASSTWHPCRDLGLCLADPFFLMRADESSVLSLVLGTLYYAFLPRRVQPWFGGATFVALIVLGFVVRDAFVWVQGAAVAVGAATIAYGLATKGWAGLIRRRFYWGGALGGAAVALFYLGHSEEEDIYHGNWHVVASGAALLTATAVL